MIDYFIGFIINTLFGSIYSIPLLYIICILIIKIFGIWKRKKNINNKVNCPKCKNTVKRISSNSLDDLYTKLSLNLFKFKRYSCFSCYWEGRLW
jgi:uncharacterized protein with PIN domain